MRFPSHDRGHHRPGALQRWRLVVEQQLGGGAFGFRIVEAHGIVRAEPVVHDQPRQQQPARVTGGLAHRHALARQQHGAHDVVERVRRLARELFALVGLGDGAGEAHGMLDHRGQLRPGTGRGYRRRPRPCVVQFRAQRLVRPRLADGALGDVQRHDRRRAFPHHAQMRVAHQAGVDEVLDVAVAAARLQGGRGDLDVVAATCGP